MTITRKGVETHEEECVREKGVNEHHRLEDWCEADEARSECEDDTTKTGLAAHRQKYNLELTRRTCIPRML